MTKIEVRALTNAREGLRRARNEYNRALTHEVTSYRGVSTRNEAWIKQDVHGNFVYRGVPYTK